LIEFHNASELKQGVFSNIFEVGSHGIKVVYDELNSRRRKMAFEGSGYPIFRTEKETQIRVISYIRVFEIVNRFRKNHFGMIKSTVCQIIQCKIQGILTMVRKMGNQQLQNENSSILIFKDLLVSYI
jgi:hypothetical protein